MKTAVLLGVGGLGCPAALALAEEARARALPLRLVLVDPDRVEASNLARQILFHETDLGSFKAEAAARRLAAGEGGTSLRAEARVARFVPATAGALLEGADVLLDGTDDPDTRFLANDECAARRLPLVHGAVLGWQGQLATLLPGGPCLRCLFEGPPPPAARATCAEAGVLSPLCGVVGAGMAGAALAVLFGRPEGGVLRRWDARRGTERPFQLQRDPACVVCARRAS